MHFILTTIYIFVSRLVCMVAFHGASDQTGADAKIFPKVVDAQRIQLDTKSLMPSVRVAQRQYRLVASFVHCDRQQPLGHVYTMEHSHEKMLPVSSGIHDTKFNLRHKPSIFLSSFSRMSSDWYLPAAEVIWYLSDSPAAEDNEGMVKIRKIVVVCRQRVIRLAKVLFSPLMWIHPQLKTLMMSAHLIT